MRAPTSAPSAAPLRSPVLTSTLASALLVGCLGLDEGVPTPDAGPPPDAPSVDAPPDSGPPSPATTGFAVLDHTGAPWEADAAPRRPILELRFTRPIVLDPDEPAVFLLREVADRARLEEDLRRRPLLVAHERLREPIELSLEDDGHRVRLTPRAALEPGARYHVALGSWARTADDGAPFAPFLADLHVAPSGAGAEVVGSWPPAGAAGVPPELAFAAVRFDGAIQGAAGVTLEGPEGRVTAEAEVVSCEVLGWREGTCVRLRWSGVLRPRATYRLRVGEAVRDRGGAAIGPWEATFETGAPEAFGLRTSPLECGLDEQPLGPGCLLADDDAARLRLRVDGPVRAFLVGEHASDRVVAPRGEVSLRLSGLGPDALERAELRLVGLAGETHVEALELRTHPPLAPLTIAEVRADARGPEPRQEYVELLNSGAVPVSLEGLAIADRPDRLGDVVRGVRTLPPGGRALLVADGFDPAHPDDPPVPDGVPLVRIGSSLASGGLSNAGEALYLRDAEGRRLSTVPAIPAPGPGVCVVREGAGRSADPIAFGAAPCTPGAP